jgi:hypothetical protein
MTLATLSSPTYSASDSPIWDSLKLAIADSSGFKCWQDDHGDAQSPASEDPIVSQLLDVQVRRYLRQTLETLAY